MTPLTPLPVVRLKVDRLKIAWMAVAITDPNPIHLEDAVAYQAGFPSVIAHGTFAIGLMGLLLTRWAGQQQVRRVEARLLAPVFPGEELLCQGEVTGIEEDQIQLRLQVLAGERRVAVGSATVARPAAAGPPPEREVKAPLASEPGSAL
jgi:acyl dehydratase